MKTLANLIISLSIAIWIGAIAIISIQNITPISLNFLVWQSIELPAGIIFAFSVGVGMVVGAIAPSLLSNR